MDQVILSDETQFPTEEIIFSHIGKTKKHWDSIFNYIHAEYPQFSELWQYYNDGKGWLLKVTKKSKTIFWLSIIPNSFRITFYFGDKAESEIMKSAISEAFKNQFKEGKRYGKIRGLTLLMNEAQNVEFVKELISIKLKY
ncbi:MAG: DUF3788 domain-containing protein [Bacteroidetes bacterium]|nr:DUF3788 domain-containing protein [Bacteroidota bacterium]MBU1116804.1 DUF3788 domain-containing protein [Bacteroidota bacterium]MBU1799433.1 DUF3788 domain-containing protein [Bacteroidota bacterium]